mmetsp:Transcript_67335/g.161439  ORF Transcript_67335/g.161439 Transcript_67335/m.161439 type:complete len:245 (-) Transcript_67335:94-828(-)
MGCAGSQYTKAPGGAKAAKRRGEATAPVPEIVVEYNFGTSKDQTSSPRHSGIKKVSSIKSLGVQKVSSTRSGAGVAFSSDRGVTFSSERAEAHHWVDDNRLNGLIQRYPSAQSMSSRASSSGRASRSNSKHCPSLAASRTASKNPCSPQLSMRKQRSQRSQKSQQSSMDPSPTALYLGATTNQPQAPDRDTTLVYLQELEAWFAEVARNPRRLEETIYSARKEPRLAGDSTPRPNRPTRIQLTL